VRLRGVGATDLTDLVSMRGSMYVVQVRRLCVCGGGAYATKGVCACGKIMQAWVSGPTSTCV
jgi:hypothetical protein